MESKYKLKGTNVHADQDVASEGREVQCKRRQVTTVEEKKG